MKQAFDLFDKNHDGRISSDELGRVLRTLGHDHSQEEVEDMIKTADTNGENKPLMDSIKHRRRNRGEGLNLSLHVLCKAIHNHSQRFFSFFLLLAYQDFWYVPSHFQFASYATVTYITSVEIGLT